MKETITRGIRVFLTRLFGLFHKELRDRDLADEIESHVQFQIEDNLRNGMNPRDARRHALVKFGAIESIKEDYRDRRSLPLLESLIHDVRYSARALRKSIGFTTVAVLTLALGIGGCAAMYAYIRQLILLEYPYRDLDSLVIVQEIDPRHPQSNRGITGATMVNLKTESRLFEDIGGYTTDGFVLTSQPELRILDGALVTPNIFQILGVRPVLGRTFLESEGLPGNDSVVILSEVAWRRYFGGRTDIAGSIIELSRKRYTVVGIMPQGFWPGRDVFTPLGADPLTVGHMRTWARLKQANTHQQAQAELDVFSSRLAAEDPEPADLWKLSILNPFELSTAEIGKLGAFLVAPVGLVFLIVCANVAHLQLGRDTQRCREMALRLAIGAGRLRLIRQLLTESLLLALLGGALGTVFASWGIVAINAYLPPGSVDLIGGLELDRSALLFLIVLSALSSFVFGLLPAVRVSGLSLTTALKEGGSRLTSRTSFRNRLVISELALSMMLLTGTGMMLVLFQHIAHPKMGFDEKNLWSARLSPRGPVRSNEALRRNWSASTLEHIAALPGVVSAAIATELPLLGGSRREFSTAGESVQAEYRAVSPAYFETLRIPIRQGRPFTDQDRESTTPVVIVNETMARRIFSGGALGQYLEQREIIGVVADVRQTPVDALAPPPIVYVPYLQNPIAPLSIVVRTQGSPDTVGRTILDTINAPSEELVLQSVFVAERAIRDRVRARAFLPLSMAVFALFGLVLSGIGLYGTTHRAVVERTQEFGIRQALGAGTRDVLALVLRQSAFAGALGLALGAAASITSARIFLQLLDPQERSAFGADLLSLPEVSSVGLAAALVLLAVILLATCLPARRATRVDPMTALRYE